MEEKKIENKAKVVEKTKQKVTRRHSYWKAIFKELAYWFLVGLFILFLDYLEFNTAEKASATFYLSMDAHRKQAFIVLFLFALIFDVVLHIIKIKKIQLYQKFIILAVSIGICYCIAVPFGQGTDEVSHFLRVYEISKKYTTFHYQDTTEFPMAFSTLANYQADRNTSYESYKQNYDSFVMNSEEKTDMINQYWNMRLYSPIQYLPQAVGVTIGRIVSDNILVIGTFGRIGGFVTWLILCAYAIKIVPNKKIFFIILCLLPVNIFSAICISGDTLTNAACMIFLAMIYRKVYLKEQVTLKDKIILLISAILIALCKIVYLPFVFLILLLNKDNFKNKREATIFMIALVILSCIIGVAWLKIGGDNLVSANEASKEQVKFILREPLRYFLIMLHTMEEKGTDFIYQFTTGYELMCHGKTMIYPIVSYCIGIAVILSLLIQEEANNLEIHVFKKTLVWLIILGTIVLIATAIYVQWTSLFEIGRYMIAGIQGRYFIPVVILLIFVINSVRLNIKQENLISFLTIMQLPVLALIMSTFVK